MAVVAEHVREADAEWAASRRAALTALGGMAGEDARAREEEGTGTDTLPLGIYEPHSGIIHCQLFPFFFVGTYGC